jgi:hypothetical protein
MSQSNHFDWSLAGKRIFVFFAAVQAFLGLIFYFYLLLCVASPKHEGKMEVMIMAFAAFSLLWAFEVLTWKHETLDKDRGDSIGLLKYWNPVVMPFAFCYCGLWCLKALVDWFFARVLHFEAPPTN